MNLKDEIIELIAQGRIDKAIQKMKDIVKDNDSSLYGQIILQSSRWEDLKKSEFQGIISLQEASIERNRIVFALLNYVSEIEQYNKNFKSDMSNSINVSGNGNHVFQNVSNSNINTAGHEETRIETKKTTILFLASNPADTVKIELEKKFQKIHERLQESGNLKKFILYQKWAPTAGDLQNSILQFKPDILHFSGHGYKGDQGLQDLFKEIGVDIDDGSGLIFRNDKGKARVVTAKALKNLFAVLSENPATKINTVIFDACYSADQSEAIAQHVPYVIGLENSVLQNASLEFSIGFYLGLAEGYDIDFCYKLGKNKALLENYDDRSFRLFSKEG